MTANKNTIHYIITCIVDFAEKYNISIKDSFEYLKKYNCVQYLFENYEIEHTLSKDDTLGALSQISHQNGGYLI